MKVAIVTIAIGWKYVEEFNKKFRPSQEYYAKKHGYDYRVITDFMGDIHYPAVVSLEKQLILSQPWSSEYDFIIFLDADILINPNAPAIHIECENTDKIGMVDEMLQPTRSDRHELQVKNGWELSVNEYYKKADLDLESDSIFNTGLIVLQPKKHGELCKNIYNKYKQNQLYHPRYFHYEQAVVNYEYQKANLVLPLSSKWNAVWTLHKESIFKGTFDEFVNNNYFIHLTGKIDHDFALEWTNKNIPPMG
jgi:hypothetical protein